MALKDERQMIPADNVDNNGTAWATIGENIRNGVNNATVDSSLVEKLIENLTGIRVKVTTLSYDRTKGGVVRCTVDAPELKNTIINGISNAGGSHPVTSIVFFNNVDYIVPLIPYNWTGSKYNDHNYSIQETFPYFVAYGYYGNDKPYLQMCNVTADDQFSVDLVIAYHIKE